VVLDPIEAYVNVELIHATRLLLPVPGRCPANSFGRRSSLDAFAHEMFVFRKWYHVCAVVATYFPLLFFFKGQKRVAAEPAHFVAIDD
jgi:hypothetical protein